MVMNNKYEKGRFRFSETFNNTSGKTSGSGFIGVVLGMVTAISWTALMISFYFGYDGERIVELLKQTLALGGTSALLLGVRKAAGAFKKGEG